MNGRPVNRKPYLAYNLHGVKGIYARNYFYTLQEEWPLAKVA